MLVKVLLLFIILVKSADLLEDPVLDPTCQSIFTYGYGYRQFYHLPQSSLKNGSIVFNFSLSSPSDGHVLFSEKTNPDPGYEIVLGGGGNTFSEIRKYKNRKSESKTHVLKKNLISATEIRNFSISVKNSVVSVYFMNNSEWSRLLAWPDREAFVINYFSLCSWTGVTAKWLFDCKGTPPAVSRKVTPLKRLKKKLLNNYDPYSIPATDIDKLTIDVSIDLHYITLDAKKSLLTTHGKFYFMWFDPKLQWNPKENDNITSITLVHREIWLPDFVLYNSEDRGSSPMENAVIRIFHNGTVRWSPEAKLITWCALDLKHWPFDEHTCSISLGLYSHPEYVHVSLSSRNVKPELILKDLQWQITSLIGETTTVVNPWEYDTSTNIPSAFTINIGLRRKFQTHVYAFVLPTVVCIFITLASFWLPIFISKRLFIHTACLFIILLNLIALDTALPALPASTPYLLTVNGNLLIITVIHIIFCSYIISKVEFYEKYVSKFLERIVTHPMVQSTFCLFVDSQYHSMKEDGILNSDNRMNQWTLFGVILDRILFLLTIIYISVILILH